MFLKTWVAEHLHRVKGKLYRYLVDDLAGDFKKYELIYLAKINNVEKLSVPAAQYKLLEFSKVIKSFGKLDELISETPIEPITKSFDGLKKALYKYEAKLRKAANSDLPIIETPDEIKIAVANRSKKALRLS